MSVGHLFFQPASVTSSKLNVGTRCSRSSAGGTFAQGQVVGLACGPMSGGAKTGWCMGAAIIDGEFHADGGTFVEGCLGSAAVAHQSEFRLLPPDCGKHRAVRNFIRIDIL